MKKQLNLSKVQKIMDKINMASDTYGKSIYGKCNYGNVFIAKIVWPM